MNNAGITFDLQMNAGVDYAAKIELLKRPRKTTQVRVKKDMLMSLDAPYLISVNKQADGGELFAAITHELGHLFCHHIPAPKDWVSWNVRTLTNNVKEFEAESVSWLICERLNIGNPSEKYLVEYFDSNDMIPPEVSLEAIFQAFNNIWDLCRPDKGKNVKDGVMYKHKKTFKDFIDKLTQKDQKSRRPTSNIF